uniref:Uncharacterized protein n=1 Tax=virus sp. ctmTa7 TaxID=2828255 RepID=A0A8S5RBW3_9VIRU|nr:MAG TPA: hypothetical protein [virus sp. ctmTa7]
MLYNLMLITSHVYHIDILYFDMDVYLARLPFCLKF